MSRRTRGKRTRQRREKGVGVSAPTRRQGVNSPQHARGVSDRDEGRRRIYEVRYDARKPADVIYINDGRRWLAFEPASGKRWKVDGRSLRDMHVTKVEASAYWEAESKLNDLVCDEQGVPPLPKPKTRGGNR